MHRKKTHFVYEHLENISSEALEKYQDVIRAYVRRRQGVHGELLNRLRISTLSDV